MNITRQAQDVPVADGLSGQLSGTGASLASGNAISGLVLPGELSTITGQASGITLTGDTAAMDTAHHLGDVLHHLDRATARMKAARAARDNDMRARHSARLAEHLTDALGSGHALTAVIRAHYPDEAAELEEVRQAVGLARGYELNARSGMISLDLPPGTITPVPGGVDDHHVTVVYLGADVDDEAFARARERARAAAAEVPGPLAGTVGGIGTFPPSGGSDGKVPAWAGVLLPGAERLRGSLEDLSASEHKDWHPHVTLAYVEPGEALPPPVPAMQVQFTHLSVHRGDDEVRRFPLGGGPELAGETIGTQAIVLAKAVSEDAKAATAAHLTETVLHELAHASLHAKAMTEPAPGREWIFNADHCESHLGEAAEHAGKLAVHFTDNYPDVAAHLDNPGKGAPGTGDGGTISAQMAGTPSANLTVTTLPPSAGVRGT